MKGKPARVNARNLRRETFTQFVGLFDHCTEFALHHPRQDDHHLYVWLEDPFSGEAYECAINTRLSRQSRMQVAYMRQECPPSTWPDFGAAYDLYLSYRDSLELVQADFREIQRAPLTDEIRGLLGSCARVRALGFVYPTGNGLHDIHMNSGEPSGSLRPNRANQDGVLALYYPDRPGVPAYVLWICLKFESQKV